MKPALHQPRKGEGYRANVDAIWLAHFAADKSSRVAFDLGAGSGAVGLELLLLGSAHVTFVEIDPDAAAHCEKNVAARDLDSRVAILLGDVLDVAELHRGEADLVVCNPPYVPIGAGRPSPEPKRARARQGDLNRFVSAARIVLGKRGRATFVYPANNLTTLLLTLRTAGLEPKRLQFVHANATAPARIALVEAKPAKPGGLEILPPLIEP